MIENANEYLELPLDQRPVILKIHGAVDRADGNWDSFVITEDHYIDYLVRGYVSGLLPATLITKLKKSHILFLGYGLRDWNLRVFLRRLWEERALNWKSWAIQLDPSVLDQKSWSMRGEVEIHPASLKDYIKELSNRVQQLEDARAAYG